MGCHCPLLLWLPVSRGPLEFRGCTPVGEERGGKGTGAGFFVWRGCISLLQAGILGEASGEGFRRLFISFAGVLF